jgi:hypothetical protein
VAHPLSRLVAAYKEVFENPAGEIVLADLRWRCHADPGDPLGLSRVRTIDDSNPTRLAINVGEFNIYMHIRQFTEVSEAAIERAAESLQTRGEEE